MSSYSGKCDFYDEIFAFGDGTDKEKFEKFLKETKGVVYQSFLMELTERNIEAEIKRRNQPLVLSRELIREKKDKFGNDKSKYSYTYYGHKYHSLAAINKIGYYALKEIRINDIVDAVPYFPYICGVVAHDKEEGNLYIQLSQESHIETREREARNCGMDYSCGDYYREKLKEALIKACKGEFFEEDVKAEKSKKSSCKKQKEQEIVQK